MYAISSLENAILNKTNDEKEIYDRALLPVFMI